MFEMVSLKRKLKKYEGIFSDILFGFDFVSINGNKIVFEDFSGKKMIGIVNDNVINFHYKNLDYERQINLELPDKDNGEDIKLKEIIREARPNGTIIEVVERNYGFTKFSDKQRALVDLVSKRYVFNREIQINDIDIYDQCVNNLSVTKNVFESHMPVLVKMNRWYKDTPYSTHTLLNGVDISAIYDTVHGIDKISRVYDLYNGVINERNGNDIFAIHLGLLSKDGFGYKEQSGITNKEDSICGKMKEKIYVNQNPEYIHQLIRNKICYKEEFNCDNLDSLIEVITNKNTSEKSEESSSDKQISLIKNNKKY